MNYHDRIPGPDGRMEEVIDLDTEALIAQMAHDKWNCELVKQQPLDPCDYFAVRGNSTIAWVEVRRRNVVSTKYKEIFMGYEKFTKLRTAAIALWLPMIFVVRFNDKMLWIDLTKLLRPKTTYASRGKMARSRATDNEKAILIPVSQMRLGLSNKKYIPEEDPA